MELQVEVEEWLITLLVLRCAIIFAVWTSILRVWEQVFWFILPLPLLTFAQSQENGNLLILATDSIDLDSAYNSVVGFH